MIWIYMDTRLYYINDLSLIDLFEGTNFLKQSILIFCFLIYYYTSLVLSNAPFWMCLKFLINELFEPIICKNEQFGSDQLLTVDHL